MPYARSQSQEIRVDRQAQALLGAGLLALLCGCVSAAIIAFKDGPYLLHDQWPHLDPQLATLVLAPAVIFWWYYFTYHWRGIVVLNVMAAVTIKQPRFWLYLVLAFVVCWLLMMPFGVQNAA